MRRFLSLTLLACLCLIANVVYAYDYVYDEEGVGYYIIDGTDTDVAVANQTNSQGVTSGDVTIPATFTYKGTDYTVKEVGCEETAFMGSTLYTGAFQNVTGITSVVVSDGIEKIDAQAFYDGYGQMQLTSVTLPSTVTSIGDHAFYNLSKLTEINIKNDTPPTWESEKSVYQITVSNVTLNVPCGSKSDYETSSWANFNIQVPEGCTDDEEDVEADGSFIFYPANDEEIVLSDGETIPTITISRLGWLGISSASSVSVTKDGASFTTGFSVSGSDGANYSSWTLTLATAIESAGTYKVTYPVGSLYLEDGWRNSSDVATNEEAYEITFTVTGGAEELEETELSMTPVKDEDGSVTAITFNKQPEIDFSYGSQGPDDDDEYTDWPSNESLIKVYNGDIIVASGVPNCLEEEDASIMSGSHQIGLTFQLDSAISAPGTYTVFVPAYAFFYDMDGETYNEESATFTFTIDGDEEPIFEMVYPEVTDEGIETDEWAGSGTDEPYTLKVKSSITESSVTLGYKIVDITDDASEEYAAESVTASYVAGDNSDTPWLKATGYYEITPSETISFYEGHTYQFYLSAGESEGVEMFTITGTKEEEAVGVTFELITPVQNTINTTVWEEDAVVVVKSNTLGYMEFKMNQVDENGEVIEWDFTASDVYYGVEDDDGYYTYTWTNGIVRDFANGTHVLTVTLRVEQSTTSQVLGTADVLTIISDAEIPVYSTVGLDEENFDPKPYEMDSSASAEVYEDEDADFIWAFTGLVKIDESQSGIFGGGGSSYSFNATAIGEDIEDGYSSLWKVTVEADVIKYFATELNVDLPISVYATDKDGYSLNGGYPYTYSYQLDWNGTVDLSAYTFDPENGATISSLSSITVGNENGIGISYNGTITITGEDGAVVKLTSDNCVAGDYGSEDEPDEDDGKKGDDSSDEWSNSYSVTITLDEAITADGVYTVEIPAGFFIIGSEESSTGSPKITLTYTIDAATGISAINAAIADGGEVYNLAGQKVNAPVKGNVYIIKTAEGTKKMLVK